MAEIICQWWNWSGEGARNRDEHLRRFRDCYGLPVIHSLKHFPGRALDEVLDFESKPSYLEIFAGEGNA